MIEIINAIERGLLVLVRVTYDAGYYDARNASAQPGDLLRGYHGERAVQVLPGAILSTLRGLREAVAATQSPRPQSDAGAVAVPRELLENLAPEQPMNQDEQGGCVWCCGSAHDSDYAGADPEDHDADCPWLLARRLLAAAPHAPAAAPLEKAFRAGWAACRDAEYVGEAAEDEAWGASEINGLAIDIEQSAPAGRAGQEGQA